MLVAVAGLLIAIAVMFPLWRIDLVAPQYPEGLGLLIHTDTITGVKENDLHSINMLNHYIGMRAIEPGDFAELRFMRTLFLVLAAFAVGVSVLGRRWAHALLLMVFAGVMLGALADMWRWGYDYGHKLDPHAVIEVPGMSYQPPLIGTKQLLNFRATSWPASGGWLLALAGGLIAFAALPLRARRRQAAVGAYTALAALACSAPGPRAIVLHQDACNYCRMTISDARFGGEVVTSTGKVLTFDSLECLASFVRLANAETIDSVYTMDAQHPGTLVNVRSAGFLRDAIAMRSPMGRAVVGFASPALAEQQRAMLGGAVVTWTDLVNAVDSAASMRP